MRKYPDNHGGLLDGSDNLQVTATMRAVAVVAGSLSNVVYCLVAVFSAMYLQQARGLSPFDSGLIFVALSAGAGAASYYAGRLAKRVAADRLMVVGLLISAVGIVGLTQVHAAVLRHGSGAALAALGALTLLAFGRAKS